MKTIKKLIFGSLLIYILFNAHANANHLTDKQIIIDLLIAKDEFVLGEPVKLNLKFVNKTKEPYHVYIDKFNLPSIKFKANVNGKNVPLLLPKERLGIVPGNTIISNTIISLYLNNYLEVNNTGLYSITAIANIEFDQENEKLLLVSTNKFGFKLRNATTNELDNILQKYTTKIESHNSHKLKESFDAAEALLSLNSSNVIKHLERGLYHTHGFVKSRCAYGLVKINNNAADQVLLKALSDKNCKSKMAIMGMLSYKRKNIKIPDSVMMNFITNSSVYTKMSVISYFYNIKDTNSIQFLHLLSNDFDENVCKEAELVLKQFSHTEH